MISDLIVASRGLRRSPAFTVAAMVTLALGIGANTTMFSVVNSVLLRPLPGYQTDRLVQICDTSANARFGAPGSCTFVAPQVYLRLREQLHSKRGTFALSRPLLPPMPKAVRMKAW